MIVYLALFLLFSFYFHFCSPISFTYTIQILFDLVLHLLLYLVFVLISIYPALSLESKMLGKDQQFHSFFPLDIYENMF